MVGDTCCELETVDALTAEDGVEAEMGGRCEVCRWPGLARLSEEEGCSDCEAMVDGLFVGVVRSGLEVIAILWIGGGGAWRRSEVAQA